jgi:CO/xanthine dehydrogenase Mo-binding subunit
MEDGLLKVQTPTQWPFHVRDTVAEVCGKTKRSVVVYPLPHFSPKDEKLINPSILCAIAALATLRSEKKVQLASRFPTYKSPLTITRKTALDEKGKPIAEEVKAIVDQGAFPLFTAQLFKQVLAGLVPLYALDAFSATVTIVESHMPPSHFFGELGYSSALFSTEAHTSALARNRESNPSNWRIKHYIDSPERSAVLETLPVSKMKDLITDTCNVSDFSRHYAVYELQRKSKQAISTFLNYSRGIGMACGAGISGFSINSPLHSAAKISITLDAKNRVLINSSYFASRKTTSLWRSIVAKELSVEKENIVFIEPNTSEMVDTGPEVLSLDVERSVMMISQCCSAIKAKRFQEPLPITESVTAKSALPNIS